MNKSKPILDYYEFTEIHHKYFDDINTVFRLPCKICTKIIGASIKITSNWIAHLKSCHSEKHLEYELKRKNNSKTVIYA